MTPEPYIDAEYVVISERRAVQPAAWSFWADDFPNLAGIFGGFVGAFVLGLIFHH